MLYIVGTGLHDEKDITVRGLEAIRNSDVVYLEDYTSLMATSYEKLENYYGKKINVVDRQFVEQTTNITDQAKEKIVTFLVIGDPFGATTHIDILLKCKQEGIPYKVINNASIMTAVGITGMQIYKFGKTTSLPFPDKNFRPITGYEVTKQNSILGLHTLLLLDLKPKEHKFMTIKQAIDILLDIEKDRKQNVFTEETKCVGVARIGSDDPVIRFGTAAQLREVDFGTQPHSLIIPGELHFVEEEALEFYKI